MLVTFSIGGKLLSRGIDPSHSLSLNSNVSFHQSMFLQQIFNSQQMFAIVLGQQKHLNKMRKTSKTG